MEKDEDTYSALKIMAETIDLSSRNDNDEIIGLEYYVNFNVLTEDELGELIQLWEQKLVTCQKEKLASQFMVVQVFGLISLAMFIAWLSGGIAGAIASIVGVIGMIAMIEDKRVQKAKRNLSDAEKVCNKLRFHA
ncbi:MULTISPECIES: hypothetical protein [unclassified Methylophaga]|jgi:uncharacterized membrane protein YheB (UPF0754 family)|uniref:hypothetical protein n=1 Tax=unclassified Methylophaga TaxID=2629249 RepID=UPI000C8E5FC0|nr:MULTISPECIES: hypothetical protein [unclassified Methylophaga]MAK66072.1 hypothetical protein [Methylophaga sp.]MAY17268.1 hypothetical protein [Methylophaga sp.]MBN45698.1 hypothetical protein [Methylophaga sp.]HAO23570.1 hypothetical protein [Methylophaga sp.]HCD05187.1 hypothetical protein [Methylophaga sp.]|tara:strand:- start:56529 stop:56933 length:405 start_codon:yes stop_codon:yes gene_type:complete